MNKNKTLHRYNKKKDKMKKIQKALIIVMALLGIAVCPLEAMAEKKGKASMKFNETVHNFGTVKEDGGAVTCEFPFVNAGDANLVVISATAECGCTKPSFPKEPVAPGKKGKISVTYNPLGRPGAFDKTVTVKTNGKPGKIRLKIRGTVMPKSK